MAAIVFRSHFYLRPLICVALHYFLLISSFVKNELNRCSLHIVFKLVDIKNKDLTVKLYTIFRGELWVDHIRPLQLQYYSY